MPYEIIDNCVHKKGSKKPLKCYNNHQDALNYLRALEANMSDAQQPKELTAEQLAKLKEIAIFNQQQAGYVMLSPQANQACANCIFYRSSGFDDIDWPHCHIVEGWPSPIEPTGWCQEWRAKPDPNLAEQLPIPVVIVEVEAEVDNSQEMALPTDGNGFVQSVRQIVKSLLNPAEPAFQVFKTKDGKKGWIARFSGKFIDREGEILADKAHDEYVERVQKGLVAPPELWMWHAKGTKHGAALTVWKSGGFVLAAGLFDETEEAERAFQYYRKNSGKIKLSHMFHYPKNAKQSGVYYAYNTVEITTLPDGAEAFPYTSFEEVQVMALPEVARTMIREGLGEDALLRAEVADGKAAADTKTLEGQGVASKGHDNYTGASIPADGEAVKALETRLAAAEASLKAVGELPAVVKSLQDTVRLLSDQLAASQAAEAASLAKYNDLEKKFVDFTSLAAPASQSGDTLLDQRQKAILEQVIATAQVADSPSIVDKVVGNQPTIQDMSANGGS